jgi:hypothetical protein
MRKKIIIKVNDIKMTLNGALSRSMPRIGLFHFPKNGTKWNKPKNRHALKISHLPKNIVSVCGHFIYQKRRITGEKRRIKVKKNCFLARSILFHFCKKWNKTQK